MMGHGPFQSLNETFQNHLLLDRSVCPVPISAAVYAEGGGPEVRRGLERGPREDGGTVRRSDVDPHPLDTDPGG